MTKTLATLFSGGGGFEAGAVAAGLTPIWGVEYDAGVAGAYARNFGPHCIVSAVEDVDYSTLQTPDHLHASPSCKTVSVANKERGETAEDIAAAEGAARAIRVLQPPNFSLENVWGYRDFESFRIILRALEESGYAFGYWHLNSADYGVPQTRKRLILLASKSHRPQRPQPSHAKNPSAQTDLFGSAALRRWNGWYRAVEDLIPTLPESKFAEWQLKRLPEMFRTALITEQYRESNATDSEDRTPHKFKADEPSPSVLAEHKGKFRAFIAHPTADNDWFETRDESEPVFTVKASAAGIPRAFIVDGKNTRTTTGEAMTLREGDEPIFSIPALDGSERHKAFVGGLPRSQPSLIPEREWLTHGRVVSMTARALARFQSIPDSYVLPEKNGLACKVIGNAVPALLAQRMVESLTGVCREEAAA
jgi:DNA-cytosine methyltransferase